MERKDFQAMYADAKKADLQLIAFGYALAMTRESGAPLEYAQRKGEAVAYSLQGDQDTMHLYHQLRPEWEARALRNAAMQGGCKDGHPLIFYSEGDACPICSNRGMHNV